MLEHRLVLPHTIIERAEQAPDQPVMVHVSGDTLSYAELRDTFLRWAGMYRSVGLDAGQTVATMLPNSFDAYHAWLGAAWLRAIEVPINNMYRGRMLRYLLENSEARICLISERFVDRLAEVASELTWLETVVVLDWSDERRELPELPFRVVYAAEALSRATLAGDEPGPAHHDISAMIYTSGTTGPSKGVLVPWAELWQFAAVQPPDLLEEGDPYYAAYPAFHISGKSALCIAARFSGHIVVRESFSPSHFWDDIREHGVRSAALVGPMVNLLMLSPPCPDDADNPLENVFMGPIIPEVEEFKERFGIRRVGTAYGMTEIGLPLSAGWEPANPRTCGRLREGAPGYEVRVVDEHDEDVGPNRLGELVVRASDPWVINAGYWRVPEKTAEAWRNGWFHTGDGFSYDEDGNYYFVDRMKDALRRRGENISSFEVEEGVGQHPAVAECAVIGVPSELGEDEVKAVIVLHAEQTLMPEELIDYLVPRMPRFMIPRYIEFVDELPKTDATFRVRKVELRENALNGRTWDLERAGIARRAD